MRAGQQRALRAFGALAEQALLARKRRDHGSDLSVWRVISDPLVRAAIRRWLSPRRPDRQSSRPCAAVADRLTIAASSGRVSRPPMKFDSDQVGDRGTPISAVRVILGQRRRSLPVH
jgi:hypothetical protein